MRQGTVYTRDSMSYGAVCISKHASQFPGFIIIIPLIKVHHSFWLENPIKTSKHFSDSDVSGQKAPWREFLPLLTGSCRSMWVSWFI